jgi:hypothetical protein
VANGEIMLVMWFVGTQVGEAFADNGNLHHMWWFCDNLRCVPRRATHALMWSRHARQAWGRRGVVTRPTSQVRRPPFHSRALDRPRVVQIRRGLKIQGVGLWDHPGGQPIILLLLIRGSFEAFT